MDSIEFSYHPFMFHVAMRNPLESWQWSYSVVCTRDSVRVLDVLYPIAIPWFDDLVRALGVLYPIAIRWVVDDQGVLEMKMRCLYVGRYLEYLPHCEQGLACDEHARPDMTSSVAVRRWYGHSRLSNVGLWPCLVRYTLV